MSLISWKDEYSVNVREIDLQHKKLIDMINDLHVAMTQGKGKDVMGGLLDKLVSYCNVHFITEEKLMQQHEYPEYDDHKDKHNKMTAKVLALQSDFKAGKANITIDVSSFLKNWLDKHILGTDKMYTSHLNSKGVN